MHLLMMRNLNKKAFKNISEFVLINNYHGLSILKLQITNFVKELVFQGNFTCMFKKKL